MTRGVDDARCDQTTDVRRGSAATVLTSPGVLGSWGGGCYNFIYGFKGAPSARHAYGPNRLREQARATGESKAARGPVMSCKGRRVSRRCGVAASAAPFGRKPYGATSCRTQLTRHRPQLVPAVTPPSPRHTCRTKPSRSRHLRRSPYEDHSHRPGTPRIIQVGPFSVKGAPRSFLTASQKGSSGPALERRSLMGDPAGLTARARPEARPEARAANLHNAEPTETPASQPDRGRSSTR